MVDGDQLNAIADPVIVTVAERNIKEFDVVPLYYDANKASPEIISNAALYHGLIRAHKFSNIGEISNMLTRLWNQDNPNYLAAALLAYLNNLRIDGAKNGEVNEYTNYPEITTMIHAATSGKRGRMPFFFQFSKNARSQKQKKPVAKPTKSTMNRICAVFDDIGNINMNWAEVPRFNYQMLLEGPHYGEDPEMIQFFRDMDGMSVSVEIAASEIPPHERSESGMYAMLAEIITEELTEKYGSLEYCYPFFVKEFFGPDGLKKPSNKKMFWLVFGEIALRNLEKNLQNCKTCSECGMRIPAWAKEHDCVGDAQGFKRCIVCGRQFVQMASRQCRCEKCQEEARLAAKRESGLRARQRKKQKKKEMAEKCISFLRSH